MVRYRNKIISGTRCKKCTLENVYKRRKKLKILAVDYLGGKCSICGYSKCISALDFHHTDTNDKDFSISQRGSISWARIKEELDKCQLLCANCHRELHAKETETVKSGLETQLQKEIHLPVVKEIRKCKICEAILTNGQNFFCSPKCRGIGKRKVKHPTSEELKKLLDTKSISAIGAQFGVSSNSIKKWAKHYGIFKVKHRPAV